MIFARRLCNARRCGAKSLCCHTHRIRRPIEDSHRSLKHGPLERTFDKRFAVGDEKFVEESEDVFVMLAGHQILALCPQQRVDLVMAVVLTILGCSDNQRAVQPIPKMCGISVVKPHEPRVRLTFDRRRIGRQRHWVALAISPPGNEESDYVRD
jgi:hypothetical protein